MSLTLLELFSGSGSVGKVADRLGYSVVSLDLKDVKIMTDILECDYRKLEKDEFQVTWASPPCIEYSIAKTTGVRKIDEANEIVLKTLEIIDYFKPKYWFIENPQTGLLKKQDFMNGLPIFDADYCKYGMRYRKRTRIWSNCESWTPRGLCKKDCGNVIDGKHVETAQRMPSGKKEHRGDNPKFHSRKDLYVIPSKLIFDFFSSLEF